MDINICRLELYSSGQGRDLGIVLAVQLDLQSVPDLTVHPEENDPGMNLTAQIHQNPPRSLRR